MAREYLKSSKRELHIEINEDFFTEIHQMMGWDQREVDALTHLQNALELYATIIEGMSEGKIPALVEPHSKKAEKVLLPSLLAQLKHEKEIKTDSIIDLKSKL